MATLETVKTAAQAFLNIADELNEQVSRYINGSDASEDVEAYWTVCEAEKKFIDALNEFEGESYKPGLNYELAEAYI